MTLLGAMASSGIFTLLVFVVISSFLSHFLTDRSFRVRIGSTLSQPFPQNIGVHQGSFLSKSYSIKINSITGILQWASTLSMTSQSLMLTKTWTSMMPTFRSVFDENGFKFSVSKTVCMHFSRIVSSVREPHIIFMANESPWWRSSDSLAYYYIINVCMTNIIFPWGWNANRLWTLICFS